MPTILKTKGFRFFFYSNDHYPIHIHVERDNKTAKYNLEPLELVKNRGFNSKELKIIRMVTENNFEHLKQKWNEHFNNK